MKSFVLFESRYFSAFNCHAIKNKIIPHIKCLQRKIRVFVMLMKNTTYYHGWLIVTSCIRAKRNEGLDTKLSSSDMFLIRRKVRLY